MSKPRASGVDVIQLVAKEGTPYSAPDGSGGGVYHRLLTKSSSLAGSQPLEADELWNKATPEDSDPSVGAFDVSGDIVHPMCSRAVGWDLSMALGAESTPTDNGDGTYTHTWNSTKDLATWTVQTGHPKLTTPKWRTVLGAKAGGFSFPMQRNGRALITVPMIGQSEVKDTTGARDAAPIVVAYKPFDNATGAVKIGGVALANVTGAQVTYSSSLEAVQTIRSDMMIDGADEGLRTLTGSFDLRLGTDHTIDDLLDAGTPAAIELSFTLRSAANWQLKFALPRVFFERPKTQISGVAGIQTTINWRAAYDATATYMLQATLRNDVASY